MKAGSKQEEGFGVQPRRVADLGPAPNLWRSSSSLHKNRSQYVVNSCEKVGVWGSGSAADPLAPSWGPVTTGRGVSCWAGSPVLGLHPRKALEE